MKRKGFTLVELLVVIAIIALLMGILMPALARVRQIAQRMVCGTNLKGIGNAMLIYSNDYDDEYPVAGPSGAIWTSATGTAAKIKEWDGDTDDDAYGTTASPTMTVTSSLFLLVKYAEVGTKQFICKGDSGAKDWSLSMETNYNTNIEDVTQCWDFGTKPGMYNSYAYQMPYKGTTSTSAYRVDATANPGSPVCADRNPHLDTNAKSWVDSDSTTDDFTPELEWKGTATSGEFIDKNGLRGSACHQRDGQNVLFNDMHVDFAKHPNTGIANDHIYLRWDLAYTGTGTPTVQQREWPALQKGISAHNATWLRPCDTKDAVLVSEKNEGY